MENINFLKDRLAQLQKKAKKSFLLKSWSVAVLVLYGIFVFAAFAYYLVAQKRSQVLKDKITVQEELVDSLRPIEAKQVYLTSKSKSLTTIFASQKQHQKIIETILALLPSGVSVDDLSIDEQGMVSFSGSCTSFSILQTFFANLEEEAENSTFLKVKKAAIGDISYGWQKEYSFEVQLAFFLGEE